MDLWEEYYQWRLALPANSCLIRYGCDRYFNKLAKEPRSIKEPKKRRYPSWLVPFMFGIRWATCTHQNDPGVTHTSWTRSQSNSERRYVDTVKRCRRLTLAPAWTRQYVCRFFTSKVRGHANTYVVFTFESAWTRKYVCGFYFEGSSLMVFGRTTMSASDTRPRLNDFAA